MSDQSAETADIDWRERAEKAEATVERVQAVSARGWHWTQGQMMLDALHVALAIPPGAKP